MSSRGILDSQLEAWNRKPCLRRLYGGWFSMLRGALAPGPVLEVGAGIGKFKEHVPEAVTLDIVATPWTDMVGDAQCLPVADGALGNIVLFDVLHHLPRPSLFLAEAVRALAPGGRVLVMDPYVSPLSHFVYKYLHPEGVDTACDPLGEYAVCSGKPFDSNQAVATVLFWKQPGRLEERFPELRVVRRERLALLAYPLSGGFGGRALAPDGLLAAVERMERGLGALAPLMAFRTFMVLEKHVR
ncbi:class I SAM-dependent methyltransferase [Desulfocurvus sp. DL9XJH121]